jgi:CRISPR-associated protein Cmr6
LLLNRFLAVQNDEGADKRALIDAAVAAGRDAGLVALYRRAFDRWKTGLPTPCGADLATPPHTRLIVGLGNKGVIEAGLRLHHTYGVPLIPGSALKGLSSHYCHEVLGAADPRYSCKGEFHTLLFGTTDDGGVIRFEDAWMLPESLTAPHQGLLKDVMTPHHQKWQTDPGVAPTDFDSPVPVPFLSVAGAFHVAVCWQGPDDAQAPAWTARALAILEESLAEWGVGGKTSSGYGRLQRRKQVQPSQPQPPPGPPRKRDASTPAQVTIVGRRPNGGFDVTEQGRNPGVIIPGTPPAGITTEEGSVVSVVVHNDDPRKPQYRWPTPPKRK